MWPRRGRFLIVSPDSLGTACPLSGRNSTYRPVQISGTSSYKHLAIAERGDPQVAEQYLPIIHLVFANLKTWLNGTHHGVSHQHLQAYLNEFTFRFNRWFYPFNAFRSLLGIAGDVTAPTYDELYSGAWKHPTCRVCG